jgi:hypothetical protein
MKINYSPWGPIQNQKQIAPGIVSVSTASHGGIYVSDEMREKMPEDIRNCKTWTEKNWYEEDCDWAQVCLAFPEFFKERDYYFAVQSAQGCEYMRHLITPERKARSDKFIAENGYKFEWTGSSGGSHGYTVWARNIADRSIRLEKTFPAVVAIPPIFTREEFENLQPWRPAQVELNLNAA